MAINGQRLRIASIPGARRLSRHAPAFWSTHADKCGGRKDKISRTGKIDITSAVSCQPSPNRLEENPTMIHRLAARIFHGPPSQAP